MPMIPPVHDKDPDDVVSALQKAHALWEQGDGREALTWLRRAVQAAGETQDDARAVELARAAAALAEVIDGATEPPPPPDPANVPSPASPAREAMADEAPESSQDDDNVAQMLVSPPMPPAAVARGLSPIPPPPPPAPTPAPEEKAEAHDNDDATHVLIEAAVEPPIETPADEPAPRDAAPSLDELEPISEEPAAVEPKRPPSVTAKAPPPPRLAPPPPPPPPAEPSVDTEADREPEPPVDVEPAEQAHDAAAQRGIGPRRPSELPKKGTKPPPLQFDEPLVPDLSPPREPTGIYPPSLDSTPRPEPEPDHPAPDLSAVEAFVDMPDDTREAFEKEAVVHKLYTDEEVSGFALGWIAEGNVAVMAIISDVPAVLLEAGAVLRSRGTVDERVPLRLVCTTEEATVVTWSEEVVTRSFQAMPWVEDELREDANRVHALIGVTLGPLGDTFGQQMLEEITSRMEPRHYMQDETIVEAGQPLPGMLILGVGKLDVLDDDGRVAESLDIGTILFPSALLSMQDAPATARAGEGGAVVMMVDRTTAQEMTMLYPPLLEELTRG